MIRKLSFFALSLFFLTSNVQSQETFTHDGIDRTYYLDVPENLAPGSPLVFVLHGYTSSAQNIRAYSGWSDISESEGVVVCYPQGTLDFFNTTHWNANLGVSETDDHGFLVALAQHLHEEYELSPECTFSCGMSNGGFMSYSLACNESETFKAIGSVTGSMSESDFITCNPTTVVPVIHLHGTSDSVVDYEDGVGNNFWGTAGVVEIMDLWTGLMGTTEVVEEQLPNQEIFDYTSVDFIRHYGAPGGQEFHHYRVNNGGHDWFGAWGSEDVQSTEVIWEFFKNVCEETPLSIEEATIKDHLAYWNGEEFGLKVDAVLNAYDIQGRSLWVNKTVNAGDRIPANELQGISLIQLQSPSGKTAVFRIR